MCRELGDIEGEDSMNELIGLVVQQRGALEEHAAKEREAEELILQLKEAMLARDGPTFKAEPAREPTTVRELLVAGPWLFDSS